jgi:hypothetical protein
MHFEQFARITLGDVNDHVEKGGKAADAVHTISGPGLYIVLDTLHSDVFEETTAIVIGDYEIRYLLDSECRMDVAHVNVSLVSA